MVICQADCLLTSRVRAYLIVWGTWRNRLSVIQRRSFFNPSSALGFANPIPLNAGFLYPDVNGLPHPERFAVSITALNAPKRIEVGNRSFLETALQTWWFSWCWESKQMRTRTNNARSWSIDWQFSINSRYKWPAVLWSLWAQSRESEIESQASLYHCFW